MLHSVLIRLSEELSGLTFLFCLFMLYFICFIVWYSVTFLIIFCNDFTVSLFTENKEIIIIILLLLMHVSDRQRVKKRS